MSQSSTGIIATAFAMPYFWAAPPDERSFEAQGRNHIRGSESDPTRPVRDTGMLAGIPMRTLLEAIRAGDRDALGTVYTALFDGLWKFALLHTRSPSTAMDVVQDVFLTLWTRREALQPETDIGVYLAVAVRHNAINRGKHQRVADRLASAVAVEYTELPGQRQQELAADARVEVNEFLAAYHRAVATLTEREQIVAYLRWEEGWTFERIGEVLGLSKVGVRKIVLRAQAKVQELLKPFRR